MFFFFKRKKYSGRERRTEERIKAPDCFLVEYKKKDQKKVQLGHGRDISVHGMRIASSVPFKKGDVLEMAVYFPKGFIPSSKIYINAKVIRVEKPRGARRKRMAMRLLYSDDSTREILRQFMEWVRLTLSPAH